MIEVEIEAYKTEGFFLSSKRLVIKIKGIEEADEIFHSVLGTDTPERKAAHEVANRIIKSISSEFW